MSNHYHESISCERPERFAHIHGIVKAVRGVASTPWGQGSWTRADRCPRCDGVANDDRSDRVQGQRRRLFSEPQNTLTQHNRASGGVGSSHRTPKPESTQMQHNRGERRMARQGDGPAHTARHRHLSRPLHPAMVRPLGRHLRRRLQEVHGPRPSPQGNVHPLPIRLSPLLPAVPRQRPPPRTVPIPIQPFPPAVPLRAGHIRIDGRGDHARVHREDRAPPIRPRPPPHPHPRHPPPRPLLLGPAARQGYIQRQWSPSTHGLRDAPPCHPLAPAPGGRVHPIDSWRLLCYTHTRYRQEQARDIRIERH